MSDDIEPAKEELPAAGLTGDELGEILERITSTWGRDPDEEKIVAEASATEDELPPLPKAPPHEPPLESWAAIKHGLRENDTRPPPVDPIEEKLKEVGWRSPEKPTPATWEGLQGEIGPSTSPAPTPDAPAPPTDWEGLSKQVQDTEAQIAAAEAAKPPPPPAPEPPPGPDWDGMLKRIQDAEHSAEQKKAIGAMLRSAAPGFIPPPGAGQDVVDAARAELEIEQRKQQHETQQRQGNEKLLADTRAAALNDPNSPESKRAQEAYAARFGDDPRLAPAGIKQMSANEIEKLTGSSVTLAGQHLTAERSAADQKVKEAEQKRKDDDATEKKTKAEGDAAAETKSFADEIDAMLADPRAKKLGLTREMLDGLNRKGLEGVRHQMQSVKQDKAGGSGSGLPPKVVTKLEDITDPGSRREVEAVLTNRQLLSKIPGRGGEQERIRRLVHQVDPNFDEPKAEAFAAVQRQQALAPDVVAMDVGRHHLKLAEDSIPDNADTNFINRAKVSFAQGTGDPEFVRFNTASKVAAHEVARIMKVDDQEGKRMVEHMMQPTQSRAQMLGVFHTIDELIAGKQEGLKAQLARFASKWKDPNAAAVVPKDHGAIKRETKSFIEYADGYIEPKKPKDEQKPKEH